MDTSSSPVTVKSRTDALFIGGLVALMVVMLWAAVAVLLDGGWLGLLAFSSGMSLVLALLFYFLPIRYVLEDDALVLKAGVSDWKIPVDSIQSITPHHNLKDWKEGISALSLGMAVEGYLIRAGNSGRRKLIFSPEEGDLLLEALAARDPNLHYDGTALIRRSPMHDATEPVLDDKLSGAEQRREAPVSRRRTRS